MVRLIGPTRQRRPVQITLAVQLAMISPVKAAINRPTSASQPVTHPMFYRLGGKVEGPAVPATIYPVAS
jgi:hypothetical protein